MTGPVASESLNVEMRTIPRPPIFIAVALASLSLCATVGAAPVKVGSPLVGPLNVGGPSTVDGMLANIAVAGTGTSATSPVDGAIIRWHLLGAVGGPFSLRVLRPAGGPAYTAVGSSSPVVVATSNLETFPTVIPIKAGDTIGLDISKGSTVAATLAPTAAVESWLPTIPEGSTRSWTEGEGGSGAEIDFNAEVQPQPAVTALSAASGSFKGGSAVTIAGTDFAGVSAVRFGAIPATSYTVGSEGQISAVAPAGEVGKSDVTVTTLAGTSPMTQADQFEYTACIVPKLKGKNLKAVKKKLKTAGCKAGKVTKGKGVTTKSGKVVTQSPKPGKTLAPGTRVRVRLG